MRIAIKISLAFFIVALVVSSAATLIFYAIARDSLERSIFSQLETAAASRNRHIEMYLALLKQETHQTSKSASLENFLKISPEDPRYKDAFLMSMDLLKRKKECTPSIYEYLLLDKNGVVVAASNEADIGKDKSLDAYYLRGQKSVFIKDAYFSEEKNMPLLAVAAPLNVPGSGEFLGVLVVRITLDALNAITTNRTGLGQTGEIIIVNKYGYMITPSRFLKETSLKKRVETFNVRECLKHFYKPDEECFEIISTDYRGEEVLTTHDYMREMGWGIITKIDSKEAFAPLEKMRIVMVTLLILVPLAAWIIGSFLARRITMPIHSLHVGTEIIGSGNLDHKVGTPEKDEIGQLSRAFDAMTGDLKKKIVTIGELDKEIALRKKAEESVSVAAKDWAVTFDAMPEGITVQNMDGTILNANKTICDMLGRNYDELIGRKCYEVFHGKGEPVDGCPMHACELSGRKMAAEVFEPHLNKWLGIAVSPILDEAGRAIRVVHVVSDITERKRAEKVLIESENKFKTLFEKSKDAIMMLTPDGGFLDANDATLELFRCGEKVYFISLDPADVSPEFQPDGKRSGAKAKEMMDIAMEKGSNFFEWTHKRIDGTEFSATVLLTKMELNGKNILQATVRDISELKEVEALKDEFVGMVSHELRTPLTALKGSIAIVLDGSAGPINDEQKDFLDTAKRNIDRLYRLINDILDYQRLEAGRTVFNMQATNVNSLLMEIKNMMKPSADAKGLALEAKTDVLLPDVIFDRDKISEVVINLINNAVKFTDKGLVQISAEQKNGSIIVSVKDTGIGIKKEDIPKLFKGFSQLEAGRMRKKGSTGLGLAISKKIVEEHRGRIWVESEEGKGADFKFELPLRTKYKAVLLYGDKELLASCAAYLKENGFDVAQFEKGVVALASIHSERPDVIVFDTQVPDMDSREIIGRLRNSKESRSIPVLVISENPAVKKSLEVRQNELAAAFMAKPFDMGAWLSTIRSMLK